MSHHPLIVVARFFPRLFPVPSLLLGIWLGSWSFSWAAGEKPSAAPEPPKPASSAPPAGKKEPEAKTKSQAKETEEPALSGSPVVTFLPPEKAMALTRDVRDSIVSVTHSGRDGGTLGRGSGFVVDADGLIATNLHVIGEARPIQVELHDGSKYDVTEVHASDQHYDLALLRIDTKGKKLKPLPLGNSDAVSQGQPILGFGSPRGLKFSVVQGVISAIRTLDKDLTVDDNTPDFPMIQIAMPVEMGNSGGPIVDLDGRALGLVTIKSLVTENLGFAVPVSHLQKLIEAPNPVSIANWLNIGVLDPGRWQTLFGGSWRLKSGAIRADGEGSGFGGRSLCLSAKEVPTTPYEVAVQVRLDDEAGAAGLLFASDGGQKHYGFYPSGGQIRLTRFEGPDVYSWTILEQISSDAYKPKEWNALRVRVEDKKIFGYLNDEKIVEFEDDALRGGKVGLCQFRSTPAEFRGFRLGTSLQASALPEDLAKELGKGLTQPGFTSLNADQLLDKLVGQARAGRKAVEGKIAELEAQVAELRRFSERLHEREVQRRLVEVLGQPEEKIDLFEAGLLIAYLDNPELDLGASLEDFEALAAGARKVVDAKAPAPDQVHQLRNFLFDKSGFHGSRAEYYHRANSHLDAVLEDREGIPITLSAVFIELARRLGIPDVHGLPFPGHFLVSYSPKATKDQPAPDSIVIDAFNGGKILSRLESSELLLGYSGRLGLAEDYAPATAREIVVRMCRNLISIAMNEGDPKKARPTIDLVLAVSPEESEERFQRALLRFQEGDRSGAKEDIKWLLDKKPPGVRLDRLQELYETL
ncbi:MAG: tetratricopeptide repeat protein [Verrucomicrobiales bacterium]